MAFSAQRLHSLGDESKLLPLWRQVSFSWCLFFSVAFWFLPSELTSWTMAALFMLPIRGCTVISDLYFKKFSLHVYESSLTSNFFPQADPRFLWNNYMLEVLIENKVGSLPAGVKLIDVSFLSDIMQSLSSLLLTMTSRFCSLIHTCFLLCKGVSLVTLFISYWCLLAILLFS